MTLSAVSGFLRHHFPWADAEAAERIRIYLTELQKWNRNINLTGIAPCDWTDKIVAESAVLPTLVLKDDTLTGPGCVWVDMGTGAGIPGLLIAALLPSQIIYLIDAKQKKTDFLNVVVAKMGLKNVAIIQNRLETINKTNPILKRNVNVFFSRALADIDTLVNYAGPLADVGAVLISPRGQTQEQDHVSVTANSGERWLGNIFGLRVPGYNRHMMCAMLTLEACE